MLQSTHTYYTLSLQMGKDKDVVVETDSEHFNANIAAAMTVLTSVVAVQTTTRL